MKKDLCFHRQQSNSFDRLRISLIINGNTSDQTIIERRSFCLSQIVSYFTSIFQLFIYFNAHTCFCSKSAIERHRKTCQIHLFGSMRKYRDATS